jgi:cyanophycin synthetase
VDKTADALHATNDLGHVSRIGVVSTAGDRRDSDMTELGAVAARHFDVVIVREDKALRGRPRGEVAELVVTGVRRAMAEGARCKQVEIVLDELAGTRHAMARSNPGDLVVICVDQHAAVMAELESYGQQAQPGAHRATSELANAVGDPDFAPSTNGSRRPGPTGQESRSGDRSPDLA